MVQLMVHGWVLDWVERWAHLMVQRSAQKTAQMTRVEAEWEEEKSVAVQGEVDTGERVGMVGAIEAMGKVEMALAAIGMVLLVGVKKVAGEKVTLVMGAAAAEG